MLHEDTTPSSPTSTLRAPGSSCCYVDLLIGNCDVSSSKTSSRKNAGPNCNKEIDLSLFVVDLDDAQKDDDDLAEINLMNSISLDDSNHFMDLDLDETAPSPSSPPLHDSPFFDNKLQKFEWNEDFSMLIKLKRTRMPTIVEEDQAPMFPCELSRAA